MGVAELMSSGKVVEDGRNDSARSAGGRCNDGAPRGILLAHGQCIGIDQASCLQGLLVSAGLYIIGGCLASQV